MDELIVLFMREFGWSLEYTSRLVRELPVRKLNALAAELRYQRDLDRYEQLRGFAMIASIMTSTQKHRYQITDFIGSPPLRTTKNLAAAAVRAGIKLPEEIKNERRIAKDG